MYYTLYSNCRLNVKNKLWLTSLYFINVSWQPNSKQLSMCNFCVKDRDLDILDSSFLPAAASIYCQIRFLAFGNIVYFMFCIQNSPT